MSKITVIGSFVMDMVAQMQEFPKEGQSVIGDDINFYPGGKGANQCIAIARLGGDVEMVGMLGDDAYGRQFKELLSKENVKNQHVYFCDKPTAIAQIQINAQGQNRICVIPSANYCFDIKHVDCIDEVIKNSDLIVLQLELKTKVVEEIISRAYNYGVKIILNPAPAVKISKDALKKVDYLTPNETELSFFSGQQTDTVEEIIKASKQLLLEGVKNLVVTLGNKGALIANASGVKVVEGYKVKAVDTVAAGDSFNGALAVALTEGKSLEEAVKFANAMGALTVQSKGAIPSLKTRRELEEFIKANSN